jgi:hypothetical protein
MLKPKGPNEMITMRDLFLAGITNDLQDGIKLLGHVSHFFVFSLSI